MDWLTSFYERLKTLTFLLCHFVKQRTISETMKIKCVVKHIVHAASTIDFCL